MECTFSITPLSATVVVGPTGRERYTHVEPASTLNPNNSSFMLFLFLKHPSHAGHCPVRDSDCNPGPRDRLGFAQCCNVQFRVDWMRDIHSAKYAMLSVEPGDIEPLEP